MTRMTALALGLSVALGSLAGCSSAPEVRSISDSSIDFRQYRTFAFANPLGTDRSNYQSALSQALKSSMRGELEARGLRYDEGNPQLVVNFSARLTDKYRVSSAPVAMPGYGSGYYGYRRGMYTAWPHYVDQTSVTPYTEGTLNIDVADTARKQLVWEGVVADALTQKDLDNINVPVNRAISSAMKKFPIQRNAE